jgi:serine/threonine protein kinase
MRLSAGIRLGTYEVVAPLGVGGMGEVYRARDVRLGRDVAIKILIASFAADAERIGRSHGYTDSYHSSRALWSRFDCDCSLRMGGSSCSWRTDRISRVMRPTRAPSKECKLINYIADTTTSPEPRTT